MRKKLLFTAMLGIAAVQTMAQGIYEVSKIPANLLENASVVIRNEETVFEVKGLGTASQDYKTAITIVNKNGENHSSMVEYYDKFSSISSLKAAIYDAKGNKVKEYKSSDFKDRSAVSGGSLYDDSRVKYLDFLYTDYPYTIEYSYHIDFSGLLTYPTWNPASSWKTAVEKSTYTFSIPKNISFKYLTSTGLKTDSLLVKDKMQYKWSATALPAFTYEPLSTGLKSINPWVMVAPNQFEYDNSKGNIENWKNLGNWVYTLNIGAQVLPEATKTKIQQLIKNAASPKEKMNILYHHLQQNTRYVGVQLGIGGFKPISAEKVAAVNYGDCKGLSNYMKALLLEAGIKSELVVIGNGRPSLNRNYASIGQANHMILCVPLGKDTTWLECTSPYVPPGFIGNDNSGRTVLLVTEDGGKLVETPILNPVVNYLKRKTTVALDAEGAADILIEAKYGNAQYEDNMQMMLIEPASQRKQILNSLSIPNVEITSLNYTQPDKNEPVLYEKLQLKSTQLLGTGAGKLFLSMNLLNRQENSLTLMDDRKTPFAISYSFSDEDEVIYTIPKGYKVEFIPKDVVLESEFGKYTCKAVVKDNTLVYTRTKVMTTKKYPAEKYNDFVSFYKKIYQADKQKSILAKVD